MKQLCFQGCHFTRISPGELCQSGDVVEDSGACGDSIYGGGGGSSRGGGGDAEPTLFADEKFAFKHVARGLLSMVNDGPNRNSSRFFITFGKMPMLDGKHVVFGFCCHGRETLDLIEKCVSESGSR